MNVTRRTKIRLDLTRPRNPVAPAARARKAGRHAGAREQSRSQARLALQRQLRDRDS